MTDQSGKPWQRYPCQAIRSGPQGRRGHTAIRQATSHDCLKKVMTKDDDDDVDEKGDDEDD